MKYEKRCKDDVMLSLSSVVLNCKADIITSQLQNFLHPSPHWWMWSKECDVIKIIKVQKNTPSRTKKWHFFRDFFPLSTIRVFTSEPSRFHRAFFALSTEIYEWTNKQANWIRTIKRCIWIIQLHVCNSHNILGEIWLWLSPSLYRPLLPIWVSFYISSPSLLMMWITPDVHKFYHYFFSSR